MQSVMTVMLAAASAVGTNVTEPAAAQAWHQTLVLWTVDVSVAVVMGGMLFGIYRLLRGPHLADRALAVDVIGIQLIGLVILLTMRFRTLVFFDGILVLSLLGFAGTVAMAQYIGRPHGHATVSGPEDSEPQQTPAPIGR